MINQRKAIDNRNKSSCCQPEGSIQLRSGVLNKLELISIVD